MRHKEKDTQTCTIFRFFLLPLRLSHVNLDRHAGMQGNKNDKNKKNEEDI